MNRFPPEIVALGAALALYAGGVLQSGQVLAGFGDPAVTFIASLFVVSEGLDATGVTTWAGQALMGRVGENPRLLLGSMLVLVALVSALITPNGSVAALLPVAAVMAIRIKHSPSAFLMPVAFAASAGSMLALTGSPVNVIVSEAAAASGHHAFGYLSFALVGVPLVLGTIAITLLFGRRLLPVRDVRTLSPDLSQHARTLARQYAVDAAILEHHDLPEALITRESGVAEVVVPPRSELLGASFPGMVTGSGDLVVLAIQRNGDDRSGETELAVGDVLLLQGDWADLDESLDDPEVLVVDAPRQVRRQAVPLGPGAKRAIAVLLAMVALLASGAVPAFVASLLAACALVLLRVLTVEQAYRSVSWTTVVLVGAMFAVSLAIKESGAAERVAHLLVEAVGGSGPHVLLVGLFVLTALFGQLISNTATALIMIPIAISAASELGVSPRPVLMSVAVAAAASFLTPIATPANMMVMRGSCPVDTYRGCAGPVISVIDSRAPSPNTERRLARRPSASGDGHTAHRPPRLAGVGAALR